MYSSLLRLYNHAIRYENSRLAFYTFNGLFYLHSFCLVSSIGRRAAFRPRSELFVNSASFSSPLLVNRALLHTSQPLQVAENQQTSLPTSNRTEPITTLAQRGSNQLSLETPQNKAG